MSPARGPARCNTCAAPVAFFRSPFTGNVRTFDPKPVTSSHPLAGVKAFPVLSRTAYKPRALAALLQVQRQATDTEVQAEMADMPWHLIHECPTDTDDPKD